MEMILCDLPYGTTTCSWDTVIPFDPLWTHYERIVKPDAAIVLFGIQPFSSALLMSNPRLFRHCWVWVENTSSGHLSAKKRPMRKHEDILVFGQRSVRYFPQLTQGAMKASRVGTPESQRTDTGVHTGSQASKTNLSVVYNDMARLPSSARS